MLNVLYCEPESMEGHAHIKSRNTLLDVHSAQAQQLPRDSLVSQPEEGMVPPALEAETPGPSRKSPRFFVCFSPYTTCLLTSLLRVFRSSLSSITFDAIKCVRTILESFFHLIQIKYILLYKNLCPLWETGDSRKEWAWGRYIFLSVQVYGFFS